MDTVRREWLKALRLQNGLTQEELANQIGVHRVAVVSWESGVKSPSRSNVSALARILGSEIHDRFDAETPSQRGVA